MMLSFEMLIQKKQNLFQTNIESTSKFRILSAELDHLLGPLLIDNDHALHGATLLPHNQEALLSLATRSVNSSAQPNGLRFVILQRSDVVDEVTIFVLLLRLDQREVSVFAGRVVFGRTGVVDLGGGASAG